MIRKYIGLFIGMLVMTGVLNAQQHPLLMLNQKDVKEIRTAEKLPPLFVKSIEGAQKEVDAAIKAGVLVPVPKDMAGGYSHEQHKQNFFILRKAGLLYQLTEEEKYAQYIRDVLLEYARRFPEWDRHPSRKSYAPGKLFWQCLNDANWLVYVSQAYDCIYDWLPADERAVLERDLFRPYADFISIENPRFFNRIHNHSTWGNAAVGMIALVMQDDTLLQRALYGLKDGTFTDGETDNDGGLIRLPGQKTAGFFAQLDNAFSPDGYYTEGPYYQRYALSPFMFFANALHRSRPDLEIFAYRDSLLSKAVDALLLQTDEQGQFFPINDAQKGMSILSRELVQAVSTVYSLGTASPELLSVAQKQGRVSLDAGGYAIARDLAAGKARPVTPVSVELRDGKDGTKGALGVLRVPDHSLAFKYTSQGMGHGHFDKLSFSYYNEHGEVLQDYGAARWVNIDQKGGGRYLPENQSWGKQTVAHNTVVVDETSHFQGKLKIANDLHSESYFFDATQPIASAKEKNAYPELEMHRTIALLEDPLFDQPLLIDVFRVSADSTHQYDLPWWYKGELLTTTYAYEIEREQLKTMGNDAGYQHLWQEASGQFDSTGTVQSSWLEKGRFFTLSTLVEQGDEMLFARLGANDPKFNLRRDPALILRRPEAASTVFVNVLEEHGSYSPVNEIPNRPYGILEQLELLHADEVYTAIRIHAGTKNWTLLISNNDNSPTRQHKLELKGEHYEWEGAYAFF